MKRTYTVEQDVRVIREVRVTVTGDGEEDCTEKLKSFLSENKNGVLNYRHNTDEIQVSVIGMVNESVDVIEDTYINVSDEDGYICSI